MGIETIFGAIDPALLGEGVEPLLRSLGVAGAGLYLVTYALLQLKLLSGDSILYTAINMCAASLVLTGLTVDFNAGAAIIQIAWILLGTLGITISVLRRKRAPQAAEQDRPATRLFAQARAVEAEA